MQIDALLSDILSERKLSQVDKVTVILSIFAHEVDIGEIRRKGLELGVRSISKWNISSILSRNSAIAVRTLKGWRLTTHGKSRAAELGVSRRSPIVDATAKALQAEAGALSDPLRREFLSEALACFDAALNKPAVVYAWIGAAWILQNAVMDKHISSFNDAGETRYNNNNQKNFRRIKSIEDFGRVKESEMLQILEDISVIGKSLHRELKSRLDLRNACGHPTTMVVDAHTTASHIHFLIENVYRRF